VPISTSRTLKRNCRCTQTAVQGLWVRSPLLYASQSSGGGRVWHVTHAHPKERFQKRRFAVALHWQRDVICRKNRSACS
jgi:hypothetical protein